MQKLTWYGAFPARLVLEVCRVDKLNRGFKLCRRGSLLFWDGKLADAPDCVNPEPLHVHVMYPQAYPATRPYIFIVSPELDPAEVGHAWHRWADGDVCIVEPKYWQMSTTAAEVIEKVADWYFNYTARKAGLIGKMPDVGRAQIKTSSDESGAHE
jgi:hypothetical protein